MLRQLYFPPAKLPIGVNVSHFEETANVISQSERSRVNTIDRLMLSQWGGNLFPVIRFMDWQKTNRAKDPSKAHRPFYNWSDLPKEWEDWDYRGGVWKDFRGVPLSLIVEVANFNHASPWVCIPDTASPNLINQMVEFVINKSRHRPIFEFSNEIWNSQFQQHEDAALRGWSIGAPTSEKKEAALYWQAKQTAYISSRVRGRATVVLCGQAKEPNVARKLLSYLYDTFNSRVDAFAIAPYFGSRFRAGSNMSWGQIQSALRSEILDDLRPNCIEHHTICQQYGISLWGYEGGQHLTAITEAEKTLYSNLNKSYTMGNLTYELLRMWFQAGGEMLCYYSLISRYENQFWGAMKVGDRHYLDSPKFRSLLRTLQLPR